MGSSGGAFEWNSLCSSAGGQAKQQTLFFQQQKVISRHHGMTLTLQQMADELLALITANQKEPTANEAAFEKIQTVLRQLKQQFYLEEESQSKKQNALQILQNVSEILNHLFFLKNGTVHGHSLAQFVDRTLKALKQTTSLSHDQYVGPVKALENRKLQVMFCFVESLTELLVHDIDTFGLGVDAYEKCGKMRREIANALMNVVYQQREAKLRLCSNLAFLRRVADIVANVPSLDQYYAGLVQNVSFNSDRKALLPFAHHLSITVPPMVRVVTSIVSEHEGQRNSALSWTEHTQKQRLYKLFSALWNLAENPIENKRVMCLDFPSFVPILLRVMVGDPREVPLIQAAIGIFKHLSTFIIQYPELFSKTLASGAIRALLHQIYSSSSELIIDALVALSTLCRHPYAAHELLCQKNCLENVQCLTKNTNEGIVRAARSLVDTINSVYYQVVALQNGMFSSVVGWNCASTSIEANHQFGHQIADRSVDNAIYYNTLPRAAQQNFFKTQKVTKNALETPKGVLRQQNFHQQSEQNAMESTQSVQKATVEEQREDFLSETNPEKDCGEMTAEEGAFVTEPLIEAGQDIATSVQCTRDGSPQSSRSVDAIADQNDDEWPSVRSTSFNSRPSSGVGSPASPSDLPDSPSQCVAHKPFQLEAMALLIKKALEEEDEATEERNGGNGKGPNGGEHGTQMDADQISGPHEDKSTSGNTLADENANGSANDSILDEVIRNYMPKPNASGHHFTAGSEHFTLNTTPISSTSPSKSPIRSKGKSTETKRHQAANGRLLEESIALMMPHPNRKRDGKAFEGPKTGQIIKQKMESGRQKSDDSLSVEEDETETFPDQHRKVTAELPVDVNAEFDAHWMVVECGTANSPKTDDDERSRCSLKKTHSQSSIPRPSVALSDRSPKKTTTTANLSDNSSAHSLLKRPAALSSARTQKAPPPPLAPKPNIAKLATPKSANELAMARAKGGQQ